MSAFPKKLLSRGGGDALAEALEPIAAVPGLTDAMFLDAEGTPLTRASRLGATEASLHRSTEAVRRCIALLRELLGPEVSEGEPLTFHFRNGWLLAWRLGGGSLVAVGREGLDLPTLRMRANILRSRLAEDRRLRRYFTQRPDTGPNWLRQTAASERERCWINMICGEAAS